MLNSTLNMLKTSLLYGRTESVITITNLHKKQNTRKMKINFKLCHFMRVHKAVLGLIVIYKAFEIATALKRLRAYTKSWISGNTWSITPLEFIYFVAHHLLATVDICKITVVINFWNTSLTILCILICLMYVSGGHLALVSTIKIKT